MALPNPLSLQDYIARFLASWVPLVGAADVNAIPATDPVRAIAGSNSGATLFLQALIYQLVQDSRASTAVGPDLDSWLADFRTTNSQGELVGFPGRAPGDPANVVINFAVQIPGGASNVPIPKGTIVQSQPVTIQPATTPIVFQVETTQDFVAMTNGTFPIACDAVNSVTVNGVTGFSIFNNLQPGQLNQLFQPINGVTAVTNQASPAGGTDQASDPQARGDFVDFMTSLSEATRTAIKAAIEEQGGGLVLGQTFVFYDYATAPTIAQPGQIVAVVVRAGGTGQYPGSNPDDDPLLDAVLDAIDETEAFGATPQLYYAVNYPITAAAITFTYSLSALTTAGLSLSNLQQLMLAILQADIPVNGGSLGGIEYFSQLAAQWLAISVDVTGGTITEIVQDVNISDLSFVTTGGTFTADKLQPGTPSTIDPLGYLSLATSVAPTFTAIAVP